MILSEVSHRLEGLKACTQAADLSVDMSMEEITSKAKSAKPAAKGSKPKKADFDEEEDDGPAPTAGPSTVLERKLASVSWADRILAPYLS